MPAFLRPSSVWDDLWTRRDLGTLMQVFVPMMLGKTTRPSAYPEQPPNDLHAMPLPLVCNVKLIALRMWVASYVAEDKMRLGIYDSRYLNSHGWYPYRLVKNFGEFTIDGTGLKGAISQDVKLSKGLYWCVMTHNTNTLEVQMSDFFIPIRYSTISTTNYAGYYHVRDYAYGLPDEYPTATPVDQPALMLFCVQIAKI